MENINFALTFKPEKQHISSILKIAKECTCMTQKQLSEYTGIPTGNSSGKLIPMIKYAYYMNLINYRQEKDMFYMELTDLGKIVSSEDLSLSEPLTLFLLHSMLARKHNGAPLWNKVFSTVLPKYSQDNFSKETIIAELNLFYENKLTQKTFAPVINSYVDIEKGIFSSLNIFSIDKSSKKLKQTFVNQIEDSFKYLYMYILYVLWEEEYPNRMEITSDEFNKLNFRILLNCDFTTEINILEFLKEKNLISINKQLTPYTIVLNTSEKNIIDNLYSELL